MFTELPTKLQTEIQRIQTEMLREIWEKLDRNAIEIADRNMNRNANKC